MKTLKLKYGEYYSLKVADSSKNIINNVEITGCQISTEQHLFTIPSYLNYENDKDRIADLMRGESRLQALKTKKDADEKLISKEEDELKDLEAEFFSWTYDADISRFMNNEVLLKTDGVTDHKDLDVPKHELKCEIQVREKTFIKKRVEIPVTVREPIKIFGLIIGYWNKKIGVRYEWENTGKWTETYRWADEYTIPRIYEETLLRARYNIELNNRLLNTSFSVNKKDDKEFEILNWRYKLTGGAIKIEKLQKEINMDEDSYEKRGKHSYSYPESTLIDANAKVDGQSLIKQIGDHVLKHYKDGRATMEMTWQGDPNMTLGDRIIIEDKFGIEKAYMITGNEFVLENSGKFYMRTEGISVL